MTSDNALQRRLGEFERAAGRLWSMNIETHFLVLMTHSGRDERMSPVWWSSEYLRGVSENSDGSVPGLVTLESVS